MKYAVTWPDEPEVVYEDRAALDSAVRLRARTFVSDLEKRLDKGWAMVQDKPAAALHEFWVELYQRYDFLIRWTQ